MTWITQHVKCPSCPSSDAYCIDEKDWGYCFSCTHSEYHGSDPQYQKGAERKEVELTKEQKAMIVGGVHKEIKQRAISKKTCEFFDVKMDDTGAVIFPYYDTKKELVAQKVRWSLDEKKFGWLGAAKQSTLFGQNKFASGQTITIVEGEFDALAFRDLSGEYPVVSVNNGAASAANDIKKHLEYFKGFQKIYICFDADDAGRKAALEVAELFPIGKVKIVHLTDHKDANDYLKAGDHKRFKDRWWGAEEYTPAGIESASHGGFDSLFDDIDSLELYPYPYDKLNELTFGQRKREMVTWIAGSGVGKSAVIGEVAFKNIMDTGKKVGMLMLEESPKKTKLRFMSLYLNKPLHLTLLGRVAEKFDFLGKVLDNIFKDAEGWKFTADTRKELEVAWKDVIERKAKDGEQQLWLFNHFGSNNTDTILSKIDAMVTGLGCEFIFLDHVSIVVSEQQNGDERKALDELATKLRTLVEHRDFSLHIVSHLRRPNGKPHEEGGETSLADIRGTAGIGQLSDIVIGLERNGQHEDEYLRNITWFRVLKNRFAGLTGLAGCAHYDLATGRLKEENMKDVEAYIKDKGDKRLGDDDEDADSVFDSSKFGTEEIERQKKYFPKKGELQ
jgi:twinkle protein